MPKLNTRIRKIEPQSLPTFDEQLWPIYAVILVLAAFLSGLVVSVGSWQIDRWWRHPLLGLVGVALFSLLLIWLVRTVSTTLVRRVTWLASLISLLTHAALVVLLACLQLFSRPQAPAKPLASRERDPRAVVIPEYSIPPVQPDDEQTPIFDTPIEAELAENAEPAVPRTTAATTDQLASSRPTSDPQARRMGLSASLPIRQISAAERPAANTAAVPLVPRQPALQQRMAPSLRVEGIEHVAKRAAVRSSTEADSVHELSRQEVATSPLRDRDIAAWTQVTDERALPLSESQPTRASYTEGLAVAVARETTRRRAVSVPTRDYRVEDLPMREPSAPESAVVAEYAREARPSTAERQDSSVADVSKAEAPRSSGPAESLTTQVVRAEPREATIDPSRPLRELPRRALRVADGESTPAEIPLPWITEIHRPAEPELAEPVPAALTRSSDGAAGLGRDSSFLDQERGADRAAPVARNSALRRHATQTMESGLAMAPSEPVRFPRRTARRAVRSTAENSIPLPQPSRAGQPVPSHDSSDAAAVASRMAADATRDLVTAAVGEANFDTGPPQMERTTPLPRASGGGQPELNFQPPEPARRQLARGRPPSAALRAEQRASTPMAPLGQGGGAAVQEYAAAEAADLLPSAPGSDQMTRLPLRTTTSPGGDRAMAMAPQTARPQRASSASRGKRAAELATALRPARRQRRRSNPFAASVTADVLQPAGQPEPSAVAQEVLPAQPGPGRDDSSAGIPLAEFQRTAGPDTKVARISDILSPGPHPRRHAAGLSPSQSGSLVHPAAIESGTRPAVDWTRRRDPSLASRLPGQEPSIVVSTPAFAQRRARREIGPGDGLPAPLPKTEQSVERGLLFLARFQGTDGRWSLHEWGLGHPDFKREVPSLRSDTAATGLALLAFLGAGYHHRTGPYEAAVSRGLEYLLRNQSPEGNLFVPEDELSNRSVALYSHAIAALALTEAYGMTQDPALREPAQRAIAYIVASQHPQWGGWRYAPGISSDTSVSGWMALVLRSGELAELRVPSRVYPGIDRWLSAAQASDEQPHLYRYNPYAPHTRAQRQGRRPSHVMTAVGLLMRMLREADRDGPLLQSGAAYLQDHLPATGTRGRPLRDTYYWYYGTQVMFHMGGDNWDRWNDSLHPLLAGEQFTQGDFAGSWDPLWPVPDRWGPHAGRLYVTAMNLLSLEVYYRHLPLYESHR